jgi:uncharacterized surface protein with fasciclin (FAS1) repeats
MSKEEFLKKVLLYHAAPGFLDFSALFKVNTIPSYLESSKGGIGEDEKQRLRITRFGWKVNGLSKIIAGNIFAKNGVIHALDNFIILPPHASTIAEILPTLFSTTALALHKTGLLESLPEGPKTFFAPSNRAWESLGFKVNAFLFSRFGEKYLAALLKYHVVPGKVVYSDYRIIPKKDDDGEKDQEEGYFHADLETLLGDKKIIVDIYRHGGFTKWRVNGHVPVFLDDVIARDGVIQVPARVLIPSRSEQQHASAAQDPFHMLGEQREKRWEQVQEEDKEMTVEELKELLEPFL